MLLQCKKVLLLREEKGNNYLQETQPPLPTKYNLSLVVEVLLLILCGRYLDAPVRGAYKTQQLSR